MQAIYNLYFHPLSKFPGPKLWAASRLPFVFNLSTGRLAKRERQLHEKYGEIIRLTPDEVSFASEQAWNDIYALRRGHKRAVRDKAFYLGEFDGCYIHNSMLTPPAPNNMADNIVNTNDAKLHARVRTLLSNSFTEQSLHTQHPLIEGMSLAAAPRYYPSVEFLFQKLIPQSVIEGQRQHI